MARRGKTTDDWPGLLDAFAREAEVRGKSSKDLGVDFGISIESTFSDAIKRQDVSFWKSRLSNPNDLKNAFLKSKLLRSIQVKKDSHFTNVFTLHTYFKLLGLISHHIERDESFRHFRKQFVFVKIYRKCRPKTFAFYKLSKKLDYPLY